MNPLIMMWLETLNTVGNWTRKDTRAYLLVSSSWSPPLFRPSVYTFRFISVLLIHPSASSYNITNVAMRCIYDRSPPSFSSDRPPSFINFLPLCSPFGSCGSNMNCACVISPSGKIPWKGEAFSHAILYHQSSYIVFKIHWIGTISCQSRLPRRVKIPI